MCFVYIIAMQISQTAKNQSHLFTFKQTNPNCYYIGVIHSFLADNPTKASNEELQTSSISTVLPVFNTDKECFTPSFVLTIDKDYYRLNYQFERQKFHDKIFQAQKQMSNSAMKLVNPNFNFCQVCKQSYVTYQTHIEQKAHRKIIAQSTANTWITQLCCDIGRKEKLIKKQLKGKANKTQPQRMTRVKKKDLPTSHELSIQPASKVSSPSQLINGH